MFYSQSGLAEAIAPFKYFVSESLVHSFSIHLSFHLTAHITDIIANIPDELALHLLSFLDLQDVVACLRVSRFVPLHTPFHQLILFL
jgi:hypothetical protein